MSIRLNLRLQRCSKVAHPVKTISSVDVALKNVFVIVFVNSYHQYVNHHHFAYKINISMRIDLNSLNKK